MGGSLLMGGPSTGFYGSGIRPVIGFCRKTIPMRDKELLQDYRYMPEPNLPPLRLDDSSDPCQKTANLNVKALIQDMPQLPSVVREMWIENWNIPAGDALFILVYFWLQISDKNTRVTISTDGLCLLLRK